MYGVGVGCCSTDCVLQIAHVQRVDDRVVVMHLVRYIVVGVRHDILKFVFIMAGGKVVIVVIIMIGA